MEITLSKALDALRHIVQEAGSDHIYQRPERGCVYVHEDQPSCGVSKALAHLGVPVPVLTTLDTAAVFDDPARIDSYPARRILAEAGFEISDSAAWALDQFQRQQDVGSTWGTALRYAETIA